MSLVGGHKKKRNELPALEWMPAASVTGQLDATVEVQRSGRRRGMLAFAVFVVVVLLAITAAVRRDHREPHALRPAPVERPAPPTTMTTPVTSIAGPTPRGLVPPSAPQPGLQQLTRLGVAFRAIVSSVDGEQMALLDVSPDGASSWRHLPRLRSVRFDSSGNWIAGATTNELGGGQVLWVADSHAAVFEPVALNVRSFAWHDEKPGTLAWNGASTPTVLNTLTLEEDTAPTELNVPVTGAITAWGEWGFAVLTSGVRFRSALLTAAATPIAIDIPGRFAAALPEGLVFTGSDGPMLVNPLDGAAHPVPWIDGDGHVWELAAIGDGSLAALIGRSGIGAPAFRADLVVRRPGETAQTVFNARGYSDLATLDGNAVLFVEQQAGDRTSGGLVHLYRTDGVHLTAPVPDLFTSGEWVAAITRIDTEVPAPSR